jgi:hypothetical protein
LGHIKNSEKKGVDRYMERQIKKTIVVLLKVCFVLSITAATVSATTENQNPNVVTTESKSIGDPNHNVVPVGVPYLGMTYEQLSIDWWKWVESIPAASNPLNDPSGKNGSIGQSGKVWFLAGSYVGTVECNSEIPAGKAIFFPVINIVATKDNTEDFNTIEKLRRASRVLINDVKTKEVIIDGRSLKDLDEYRVGSKPFVFTKIPISPTHHKDTTYNLLNLSGPTPAVSDGYWILLKPLSEGKHTIRIHGMIDSKEYGGFFYETDVTYKIKVEPKRY